MSIGTADQKLSLEVNNDSHSSKRELVSMKNMPRGLFYTRVAFSGMDDPIAAI